LPWGWPATESGADGIEVFSETDRFDTKALVSQLKAKLPVYMLPRNVLAVYSPERKKEKKKIGRKSIDIEITNYHYWLL
jgi:hypothetical protein